MQTEMPFFECPEDALRAAVQHLGGAKKVGLLLWPDRSADAAARLLLDCLNVSRAEKLELSQVMRILALAKEAGAHQPAQWIMAEVGYDLRAITKAEEVDRVTSVIEQSSRTLAAAMATLERLQRVRAAA